MTVALEPHIVTADNAALMWEWLNKRGGLALWRSLDLSNPGQSWTTPVNDSAGYPKHKPHWSSETEPHRIITDPAEVVVSVDKEVRRFHVAVRMGGQGFSLKVSDGGSRKIRSAVAKAGEGAYHVFDYDTQEAVIMAPAGQMKPIAEFVKED